jgi:oligopeptide/dipeptide ABC transporter ATP-binding protein
VTPLLEIEGVHKTFAGAPALADVSFTVGRGEAVALVGESGSGKSTIARVLLALERADAGRLRFAGAPVRACRAYRRQVQMVFQDPFASLNPTRTVRGHLARPLLRHRVATRATLARELDRLVDEVGLTSVPGVLDRHPHELSGGQRQRVAIARALAPGPSLLVADEPTSMLDVSLRLGVLDLFARLERERGLSLLFITHDLASARVLAGRLIVLHAGRIVEVGPTAEVLAAPAHPYTQLLLAATPRGVPGQRTPLPVVEGEPAAKGCAFAARCPEAVPACRAHEPPLVGLGPSRQARCHLLAVRAERSHPCDRSKG